MENNSDYIPADSKSLAKENAAKDEYWQKLADEALRNDKQFQRWKVLFRSSVGLSALLAGGLLLWWMLAQGVLHARNGGKALALPFVVILGIWATGENYYTSVCRKRSLNYWCEKRAQALREGRSPD